jgi:oxygen-dependent protoporphyrinogen oxidase
MRPAIVIGGGLSGLVCAYRLQQSRVPVLLLEGSSSPGGMIATREKNGFIFECGPQAPRFSPALWQLIRELGLESEFVAGDSRAPRYILKNGRLHPAPFSPGAFLGTSLVSVSSKYRLLCEPLRRTHPPDREESLAAFITRKFDADTLDYLVDPFISALLAGDVHQVGVASAFPFLERWEREQGSLLRGALHSRSRQNSKPGANGTGQVSTGKKSLKVTDALPSLGNFRSGLAALPTALARALGESVRLNTKVEAIEGAAGAPQSGNFTWRVRLASGDVVESGAVVLATPAYESARILQRSAPDLSAQLAAIAYAPIAVVSSGYARAQVRHRLDGFGIMIPRREKLRAIFQTWNSSIFPGRAPDGYVLINNFAGGSTDPEFVMQDDDAVANAVENETAKLLQIEGPPVERMVWKHPRAFPQFNVGHKDAVASIAGSVSRLPGIVLAGNYLAGRSLGECYDSGAKAAEEAQQWISSAAMAKSAVRG